MRLLALCSVLLVPSFLLAQALPTDEAGAIDYLSEKGVTIKQDSAGHAVQLMSSGKPAMTAEEYQLIGMLPHLERMGINGAPLSKEEWKFLKKLPNLKTLSIWHCAQFAELEAFSGLPVESLTIGGCMGLRNLNRDNPEQLRHAVTTLHDLPKIKKLSLYHSPLLPDDAHLKHVAKAFPTLEELRVDFAAPRGTEITITPAGLEALQELPLKVLYIEHVQDFTPEHFRAIAGIKTLEALLIDARRTPVPTKALETFGELRPEVQVVVAKQGDNRPPRAKRK